MNMYHLDLVSSDYKRDPYSTWAKLRDSGPVVKVRLPFIGKVWAATTYESVTKLLRDDSTFVRDPKNAGRRYMMPYQWLLPRTVSRIATNMMGRDEPHHRRLRQLVEVAFQRQTVTALLPRLEVLATSALDQFDQQLQDGGVANFIDTVARPFPLSVICELLGLPHDDRPLFMEWGQRMGRLRNVWDMLPLLMGLRGLEKYIEGQILECRRNPRPGLLCELVQAEMNGDRLSHEELMATIFLILFAGHETTVHLITAAVLMLLTHDDQKRALMSDWNLSSSMVNEVLRYYSPIELSKPRYVSQPIDFFGAPLKRKEYIIALLASANHDPARFVDPEQFDITRDPNPHLSFGTGPHVCLGMKLALAETQILIRKLFERFPQLSLTTPINQLHWLQRPGIRTVQQLPLALK